ncbi:UNVERIFIED_CONTAM: hypothetical protein FKN15_067462 [Acipenser sinensis]
MAERGRSKNPWAKEERGIKMAELGDRQTAPQAEGHCAFVIEGEGDSSAAARTSSATEIGGAPDMGRENTQCGGNMLPGASRQSVKAGRYDGRSPWEAYHVKFRMAALTNDWGPTEKAGQLSAALEGEALQVLLDLGPDEVAQYEVLTTALERHFGRVEPAVELRLQLANRTRAPREKLGVLAADVRYLARRGYPTFQPATQEDLAVEAFVRGLTPTALRQQVRFAASTSLELAVAHAE